jgi:hypothetical protein
MIPRRISLLLIVVLVVGAITFTTRAALAPKPVVRTGPRLVAVAETRLLMEGLTLPNFQGLEKLLKEKPTRMEAWTFARGQALLIAETGNLLMIRPPHNKGEKLWLNRAGKLRTAAAQLARALAKRDFTASRKSLAAVAAGCNACHKSFRVEKRIIPFADKEEGDDDDQEMEAPDFSLGHTPKTIDR